MNHAKFKAVILTGLIAVWAVVSQTACGIVKLPADNEEMLLNKYDATFLELFDTVTSLSGFAEDEETFRSYADEFKMALTEYHQLYDIYNDYEGINNIKTINDQAGIAPVEVDQRIIDMLMLAKEMYHESGGTFNVAMGSVLKIWHDYRTAGIDNPEAAELPPMEQLQAAAKHIDMDLVEIDPEAMTVYLPDRDMRLDVGAIAKGYAVEQICRMLEADGINRLLVSVGGNVRTIGGKTGGDKWMVGIQNPDQDSEVQYLYRVALQDVSLVTSGVYQRYYTVAGKTYHHLIDPDTLMPSDAFLAVSIICPDSGMADALSTAVFNMPLEDGMALIEAQDGAEAMWIARDGSEYFSSGFKSYLMDD